MSTGYYYFYFALSVQYKREEYEELPVKMYNEKFTPLNQKLSRVTEIFFLDPKRSEVHEKKTLFLIFDR